MIDEKILIRSDNKLRRFWTDLVEKDNKYFIVHQLNSMNAKITRTEISKDDAVEYIRIANIDIDDAIDIMSQFIS